jgi:hypothetical protein
MQLQAMSHLDFLRDLFWFNFERNELNFNYL